MRTIKSLHDEAMRLVEDAAHLRVVDPDQSKSLLARAFQLESEAACRLVAKFDHEPTRSILLNSAARLALDLHFDRDSERLASAALSGNPPEFMLAELRRVVDMANFSRHMESLKFEIQDSQTRLMVHGSAVSPGLVEKTEVFDRVNNFEEGTKIELAVAAPSESRRTRPGPATKTYLHSFGEGSFLVTLSIGTQAAIPGLGETMQLVPNMFKHLAMIQDDPEADLEAEIPDLKLRRRFIEVARRLAPDGTNVSMVGLAYQFDGQYKDLQLVRTRSEFQRPVQLNGSLHSGPVGSRLDLLREEITLTGEIRETNSKNKNEFIEVLDDNGKYQRVHVPDEVMTVTIPNFYKRRSIVTVEAVPGRKFYRYLDIRSA